jgi:hypothetical protein
MVFLYISLVSAVLAFYAHAALLERAKDPDALIDGHNDLPSVIRRRSGDVTRFDSRAADRVFRRPPAAVEEASRPVLVGLRRYVFHGHGRKPETVPAGST